MGICILSNLHQVKFWKMLHMYVCNHYQQQCLLPFFQNVQKFYIRKINNPFSCMQFFQEPVTLKGLFFSRHQIHNLPFVLSAAEPLSHLYILNAKKRINPWIKRGILVLGRRRFVTRECFCNSIIANPRGRKKGNFSI